MRGFMKLDIPQGDFAGYLFDLDGTLVDTMPLHFVAWRQALWQCGLERDLDEDFFYSFGGVPTLLVAQRIGEHYGVKLDAAQVEHVKERIYQAAFVILMAFFAVVIFNDLARLPIFTHIKP